MRRSYKANLYFLVIHNSREIELGHRVGFYTVKGNLGKGNFSTVKMAIHSLTQGEHFWNLIFIELS